MKKHSIEAKEKWIRRVYKFKVSVVEETIATLKIVNSTLVKLWNLAIDEVASPTSFFKGSGENPTLRISDIAFNYWLTRVRNTNTEIAGISCSLEREVLRRLAGSFSSFFALKKKKDAKARPPRSKLEESFIPLTFISKSFKFEKGVISGSVGSKLEVRFSTIGDYVKVLDTLPKESEIAQILITKNDDEFWAHFTINLPKPVEIETKKIIAIDLGSGDIACSCSDGAELLFPSRRPDKNWMEKIEKVEKRVASCKKDSRSWKRRMKARRTMHLKSGRQHADHQKKFAKWISSQKAHIVIGKMHTRLGLAKSSGTADQHWGAQNTGYAFRALLYIRQKAEQYGLKIIELPDPKRKGGLNDPDTKFKASRELLGEGCKKLNISFPMQFTRIEDFSFPQ